MQEIIDFLRKKEIDFELNQDSETAIVRFKIGGYSLEVLITDTDTVNSFKSHVNARYKYQMERDYQFFSDLANELNKKLSEYKGIL